MSVALRRVAFPSTAFRGTGNRTRDAITEAGLAAPGLLDIRVWEHDLPEHAAQIVLAGAVARHGEDQARCVEAS